LGIFNFQNIKKSSIYITPNFPAIQTRRYKFSLPQVLYVILGYSFFVTLIVITLLALTPAKELIFILENEELLEQADRIRELEKKVIFLTSSIEEMASTNHKLKYALMLGGIKMVDSTLTPNDTIQKKESAPLPAGGNILHAFRRLFPQDQEKKEETQIYFIRPITGLVVNGYNPEKGHMGIDYSIKEGTPVFAAAGGLVIFADFTSDDGYMYIIQHDANLLSIYKHCSTLLKRERDYIVQGELIALSGNTGYNTTGPHLHFEIWKNGKAIDPLKFIIN